VDRADSRLPERLEGDGLLLRRWHVADAEALARAVTESEDHLRPWMGWMAGEPQTLEERRTMLAKREREWRAGGDVMLGIFVGGTVAGSCGLHRRLGPTALEIGYWVHSSFTRRGLATTAARLLTEAALSAPEITHVEIHTDKANSASAGVPQRLGYRLMAERPDERHAPAELGIECVWRMERDVWERPRRDV
jgi:RimJ/RimL family protein N-acetyltransferase